MRVQTSTDFGLLLRDRRRRLGLNQQTVAERLGVTRQWVAGVERGKARADLGLFLQLVKTLGLRLSLDDGPAAPPASTGLPEIDIDAIVDEARGAGRKR